ncbi:MAG TPA: TetR/AcrR family transcriptional regulator, partial [Candidatus Agrococcus pullicola]|nr:TetR/AcrR family transcriptional regulator [Candidatus Agrococcus pullicola]
KAAIVDAAYADTLSALVADISAVLDSAEPADRPAAYIRTMVRHFREHPSSVRMITEAMRSGDADHERKERWGPLAAIIDEAAAVHGAGDVRARDLAVIVGGAIDGIVIEQLEDPAYDSAAAAERLVTMLESMIAR